MTKKVLLVGVGICSLLLLNVLVVIGLTWPVTEFSVAKAGALGDSFGWLNSVFSGLAFLGVLWTLLHQQEELKEARESVRLERFEATFFELLSMLRRNLDDIRIARPGGGEAVVGVEALSHFSREFTEKLNKHSRWLEVPTGRLVYQKMIQKHARAVPLQGRYLGTLRATLELVERDLTSADIKSNYLRILASQLTSTECRYVLLLALRGKRHDHLSRLFFSADPVVGRLVEGHVGEMQRELFERLYSFALPKRSAEYDEIDKSLYRQIRKTAEKELREMDRIKKEKGR